MNETNKMASITECSLEQIFKNGQDKYFVPLYQREYAWGRVEIGRMLNDLFSAFWNGAGRNYYLGSLVVRKNGDEFELVDGQQRLITLSMLFALYLNEEHADKVLRFQLRKDADASLDACYGEREPETEMEAEGNDAFCVAIREMRGFSPEILEESGEHGRKTLAEVLEIERDGVTFKDYILKKVILFRIEIPEETDVNSYFEIMNSRGEQLQYHEIMKAELLAKLHEKCNQDPDLNGRYDELAGMFDDIWSACSKMNGYLGHHLHMSAEYLGCPDGAWTDAKEWKKYQKPIDKEIGKDEDEQSVIWEFANFLMHVLKCYQKKYIPNSDVVVTLDERDMQVKYEALKRDIDPIRFLDLLIRLRLKFDNFVVKAENDENGDVEAWYLSCVKKNKKSYDAGNTFGDNDVQTRLIYFESMLQVSFNTQRSKDWLQFVLELDDAVLNDGEEYLIALKGWARTRLANFKAEKERSGKDFYCLGLESSRFMLNLVDYLMWENFVCENGDADFEVPSEFVFKYLNSVEHHHPQHDDQLPHVQRWHSAPIDDIGNLFLVYSSENASMNNREPQSKKHRYIENNGGDLPANPKRRWMYEHTYDDGRGWPLSEMQKLSRYVRKLLDGFAAEVENV